MTFDLMSLSWLPAPPEDFRIQLKALLEEKHDFQARARNLAAYRLPDAKLHSLGKAILTNSRKDVDSLEAPVRLGVLSNGTTDLLIPAFAASALRHGVWLNADGTSFGQFAQEALDPRRLSIGRDMISSFSRSMIAGSALLPSPGQTERAHDAVEAALVQVEDMRRSISEASGAVVILQTLPQVPESLFGSLDRRVPGTSQWLIDAFNRELRARMAPGTLLLDVAALAESLGLPNWHDPVQWNHGKFLLSHRCVPVYADWLGRLIGAARGKARKCLVLDLDNTLWGGVIGDDGLAGIVLGNGDPTGEAFLDVQRTALALRDRGVVLAVSSKNDDLVARSVFRSHPEMLLREEHIAVFQANWMTRRRTCVRLRRLWISALTHWSCWMTTLRNARKCAAHCPRSQCRNCRTIRHSMRGRCSRRDISKPSTSQMRISFVPPSTRQMQSVRR